MTVTAWVLLRQGSIILSKRTKKPRMVISANKFGCVTLEKISGDGITVYCTGDRYLFLPTGMIIKQEIL
jgi:hypothetical protein